MKKIIFLILSVLLVFSCKAPPAENLPQTYGKPAPAIHLPVIPADSASYWRATLLPYPPPLRRRAYKLQKKQIRASERVARAQVKAGVQIVRAESRVAKEQAKAQAKILAPPAATKKIIVKDKSKVKEDNSENTSSGFPWWALLAGVVLVLAYKKFLA